MTFLALHPSGSLKELPPSCPGTRAVIEPAAPLGAAGLCFLGSSNAAGPVWLSPAGSPAAGTRLAVIRWTFISRAEITNEVHAGGRAVDSSLLERPGYLLIIFKVL